MLAIGFVRSAVNRHVDTRARQSGCDTYVHIPTPRRYALLFIYFAPISYIIPGTVISIHPNSRGTTDFTSAITTRLHQRDTGLRKSADPSMLVQSLLDLSTYLLRSMKVHSHDVEQLSIKLWK